MAAILFLILGTHALWLGWRRWHARDPRLVVLSPSENAALWLARVFQGDEQAQARRRAYLRPARLRQFAVLYLVTGGVLLTAALVQAAASLAQR